MSSEEELRQEYDLKYPLYLQLGKVLESRINTALKAREINFDYVQMRVKSFVSFFEKIDRNEKWENPFEENEDFCGLRIIHLFDDDLDEIKSVLKEEFIVFKEESPTSKKPRTIREFTYRSYHALVRLKGQLPDENKKIRDLTAEVQIRTICMHTWAAIEHKLNYKQQKTIPAHFRPFINRKFSQMSAVFEIADDFFVSLRNEKRKIIAEYKSGLKKDKSKEKEKILNEELNIDALQAYLENKFPNVTIESKSDKSKKLTYFLNELLQTKLTLKSIEAGVKTLESKKTFAILKENYPGGKPTQTGMARLVLDITNNDFYHLRKEKLGNSKWMNFVSTIRKQLKQ